jgi:hypothetical protein
MSYAFRLLCCIVFAVAADEVRSDEPTAPLWQEFVAAKASGDVSALPDFSYAGYHFSEQPLPEVSQRPRFDVTAYGALPDDEKYDEAGIQAAVDAADAASGGVVYFPEGKYLIAPDRERNSRIRISKSNIVLKGAGSGDGGTEIFMSERRIGSRQFVFRPEWDRSRTLTTLTENVPRESFWVSVADASKLEVGQTVVLRHRSEAFTRQYFEGLPFAPEWKRLVGRDGGMKVMELHEIAEIDGSRLRFKNPVHLDVVNQPDDPFRLESYATVKECGVEGIRFTGNWASYPEEFVHHKDGIHDSGWCALTMENVENSWIRDCEFRDWNECINLSGAFKTTVEDVRFTGKKGHTSVLARSGTGVLIKNCRFDAGHHHGPGVGYGAVNTVVTQCQMEVDQNIDSHSGQPFATLYDNVRGGIFRNLGGPHEGLPHHGQHLVFWNFEHRSTDDFHYNFWDVEKRRNHTIAKPTFVGFRADRKITFENEGRNESPGKRVTPRSLFEAQLALRLKGAAPSSVKD